MSSGVKVHKLVAVLLPDIRNVGESKLVCLRVYYILAEMHPLCSGCFQAGAIFFFIIIIIIQKQNSIKKVACIVTLHLQKINKSWYMLYY